MYTIEISTQIAIITNGCIAIHYSYTYMLIASADTTTARTSKNNVRFCFLAHKEPQLLALHEFARRLEELLFFGPFDRA